MEDNRDTAQRARATHELVEVPVPKKESRTVSVPKIGATLT